MNLWYNTRRRAELLLAPFRILLVVTSAVWTTAAPQYRGSESATLLAVALAASVAMALVLSSRYFRSSWRVVLQGTDALLCASVVVAAPGDFVIATAAMLFLLFGAMLRFEWNETLAIGLVAACGIAWIHALRLRYFDRVELLYVLILCVMAAGASSFGFYIRRKRMDIAYALRPPDWSGDGRSLVVHRIENAAHAMHVSRVAVLWRNPDGRCELLEWQNGEARKSEPQVDDWADLTAEELNGLDFFTDDAAGAADGVTIYGRVALAEAGPVSPALTASMRLKRVLVSRIESSSISGALFFMDRAFDSDDLMLGRLVSEVLGTQLDAEWTTAQRQRDAAIDERTRLSRDLHDGLLQSLGGVAMQLEAIGKMVDVNPEAAKSLLRAVQDILSVDQHELRSLVNTMRAGARLRQSDLRSGTRFTALAALVRLQWGIDVDVRFDSLDGKVDRTRRREIHRLLREAVFNAAKHAKATRVVVEGGLDGDLVRIVVSDDGQGFAFRGRYDLAQLTAMNAGPLTLKERVALMGGALVIDSSATGSRLEIVVPLNEGAAA